MITGFPGKIFFILLATMAGIISAFAMPPAAQIPALFIGLSALYALFTRTQNGPQAFAAGFFFGLGYFVTGLWWIGNALLVEGNEFAWVWPISVIGLPTLLSLFTGTFLAIARMSANPKSLGGFLAFAFFLTLSEWTRGTAFTGFPWNLYGYVWIDYLPMAQSAFLFGAYGLTLVTILWAASPAFLLCASSSIPRKLGVFAFTILTIAGLYAWGQMRLDQNPTRFDESTAILAVQPNIPQNMKWDPDAVQENFEKTLRLSSADASGAVYPAGAENLFIVWPETAISPAVYYREENIRALQAMLGGYDALAVEPYLVSGILRRLDGDNPADIRYGNSVGFFNAQAKALAFYNKTHLVPFGEFIPFQQWIPLKPVVAFKGFEPGDGAVTIGHQSLPAFSPLICYEVIFPDAVTAKDGSRPRWLVNVTNDGWYGDSAGPHQHFAQSRLRAIEEGLPLIRSANTGISGIIDPYGRIIAKADIFTAAAIASPLPLPLDGKNPWWPWSFQAFLCLGGVLLTLRLFFRL
ncbi:MAG: apolipoprotein N-acyltransferase [Micavibrio sp.]